MRNAEDHLRPLDPGSVTASEQAARHVLDETAARGEDASRPKAATHFTPAERIAQGKAARPRASVFGARCLGAGAKTHSSVDLLEEQTKTRLPELGCVEP